MRNELDTAPIKLSPIRCALDLLSERTTDLSNAVGSLSDKLMPILCPTRGLTETDANTAEPSCALEGELICQVRLIAKLRETVVSLINSIAL